jgi:hypothetical protein
MDDRQEQIAAHLQQCLDLVLNENKSVEEVICLYPGEAEELGPLIEQAVYLHAHSAAFDPDPQFVQVSKQRLLKNLSGARGSMQKPATGPLRWNWLLNLGGSRALAYRFAVVMVLFIILFAGGTGVAFASQNALPGDPLYGAKIGLEDLTLAFTPDQQSNILLNMQYADRRLAEIRTLQAQGRFDQVAPALLNYQKHIDQANKALVKVVEQDPAHGIQTAGMVQERVASQLAMLDSLVKDSPGQTQKDLVLAQNAAQHSLEAAQRMTGVVGLPTDTPASPSATSPAVVENTPTGQPSSSPTHNPPGLLTKTPPPFIGFEATFTVRPPGFFFPNSTPTLTMTLTTTPTPKGPVVNPKDKDKKPKPTKKPHPTRKAPNPNKPDNPPGD